MRHVALLALFPLFAACPGALPNLGADDSLSATATTGFDSVEPGATLRTTEDVNLREAPGSDSRVLRVVPAGTDVTVTTGTLQQLWLEVTAEGAVGWVFAPYVTYDACLALEEMGDHLEAALASCPVEGDAFDSLSRAACEAGSSECSTQDLEVLTTLGRCIAAQVPVCQQPEDRATAETALQSCAPTQGGDFLSLECAVAIGG